MPVVRLSGVIGLSTPLRPGLTLAGVARPLERAFGMRKARAVALLINSPGGSPVQSHLIYRRIRHLAAEKGVPVIAFAEDVAASGGYMIACAADEIICDASSIVGSIGVVGGSFGFARADGEARHRAAALYLGRAQGDARSVPAGEAGGRGAAQGGAAGNPRGFHCAGEAEPRRAVQGPENDLFSGEYWTGRKAVELGIADGIGDLRSMLRQRFGDDVVTPLVAPARGWFGRAQPGVGRRRRWLFAPSGFRRGDHLGAGSACAVGALWLVSTFKQVE